MKTLPIFQNEESLPRKLGALDYKETYFFDDPKAGIELRYGSPEGVIKADIYLYDGGMAGIPDDIKSPLIMQAFQESCGGVMEMGRRGNLLDLEVRESRYLSIPPDAPVPQYLWACFSFRQASGPGVAYLGARVSHLALRADRGLFNKVRYTYPDINRESDFTNAILFLTEWHTAVQAAVKP